ncbi:MAG TPA: TIGR01777 family oxidoreductase [Terriglobales bacterium]|nr:TIGR01777 family oxidoreductase [Terriglobales bacterium]
MKSNLKIVLAGGSGQVGRVLARHFGVAGHQVTILSRNRSLASPNWVHWDGTTLGNWISELKTTDVLINLAGRSVNCRYTRANRREIIESRVQPTILLGRALNQLDNPPRIWINASTATIYRHSLNQDMDEAGEIGGAEDQAPQSWRFSIEVARRWEEAFFSCSVPDTRKIAIRNAMVMSPDRGSVFDILLRLVRFGFGGRIASGSQYVSWIHELDFVNSVHHLISHPEINGAINIASPKPLPNRDFMSALRKAWGKKFGLSASRSMLEVGTFLLRTESELVLKSRRVVPKKLLQTGFQFAFPEWRDAALDLVQCWRGLGSSHVDSRTYEPAR